MEFLTITRIIVIAGLVIGLVGLFLRLRGTLIKPRLKDLSRSRGSPLKGVLYAFTLGMAPWEKESTRLHWVAYFRGIFFHIGIFAAFGVLFSSPWLASWPQWLIWLGMAVTGLGALFGYAGIIMRLVGENERVLSLPDDYFSIVISASFILLAFLVLFIPALLPYFYLLTAVMAVYIPFSKIRHCAYFFYAKYFFGYGFGRRGVIGQSKGGYAQ